MQLPEHLQHFPQQSLLVVADHVVARLFIAGGDSLEELDGLAEPRDVPTDNEGKMFNSDVHDEPRLKRFCKNIALDIQKLVVSHDVSNIHLVMPAELAHLVTADLSQEVQRKLGRGIHLDLMKEDPLKIVERLLIKE